MTEWVPDLYPAWLLGSVAGFLVWVVIGCAFIVAWPVQRQVDAFVRGTTPLHHIIAFIAGGVNGVIVVALLGVIGNGRLH